MSVMTGAGYRFLVTLDDDTKELLFEEAEASGVSAAEVIRRSLRSYVGAARQVRNPRKRTLASRGRSHRSNASGRVV